MPSGKPGNLMHEPDTFGPVRSWLFLFAFLSPLAPLGGEGLGVRGLNPEHTQPKILLAPQGKRSLNPSA